MVLGMKEERIELLEAIVESLRHGTGCGCCMGERAQEASTKRFWLLQELAIMDGDQEVCVVAGCLKEPHLERYPGSRCEPEDRVEEAARPAAKLKEHFSEEIPYLIDLLRRGGSDIVGRTRTKVARYLIVQAAMAQRWHGLRLADHLRAVAEHAQEMFNSHAQDVDYRHSWEALAVSLEILADEALDQGEEWRDAV